MVKTSLEHAKLLACDQHNLEILYMECVARTSATLDGLMNSTKVRNHLL